MKKKFLLDSKKVTSFSSGKIQRYAPSQEADFIIDFWHKKTGYARSVQKLKEAGSVLEG